MVVFMLIPTAYAIDIPENAYGIITIPCINIKMPIYCADINDREHRQAIIDEDYSALYSNWGKAYKIGDHCFSEGLNDKGEWNLQKVFPNASAYLYTNQGNYWYRCYLSALTEYDGNEYVKGKIVLPSSSYDIMTYCCVGSDSTHHFIAIFERVRELK